MLTIKDLDEIEKLIDERLEEKLNDKLRGLPSRDEFYKMMDELMGEIKAVRQELTMSAGQYSRVDKTLDNHEIRIKDLEKETGLMSTPV